MKNVAALFLALLVTYTACSTHKTVNEKRMVNFTEVKSRREMLSLLQKQNKFGLFYLRGCNYKPLEELVFKNPETRKFIEGNFYPLLNNVSAPDGTTYQPSDIHQYYGNSGLLAVDIVDIDGEIIQNIMRYALTYDNANHKFDYRKDDFIKQMNVSLQNAKAYVRLKHQYNAHPNDDKIALQYADKLMDKYKHDEAMPIYQDLLSRISNDSVRNSIYSNLLTIYLKPSFQLLTKYLDKAIQITEEGLAKGAYFSRMNDAYFALGNMYFWKRDYISSIKHYEKVPQDYEFLFYTYRSYLPISYFKTGQREKAEAFLDNQYSQYFEQKDFRNLAIVASICAERNIYIDKSLYWLERCDFSTNHAEEGILRAYAQVLARSNKLAKAIEVQEGLVNYYRKSLLYNYGPSVLELAILNFQADNKERALQILNGLNLEPMQFNGKSFMNLAWLLYKNNINIDLIPKWVGYALKELGVKDIKPDTFDSKIIWEKYAELLFQGGYFTEGIEVATFNPPGKNNVE